MTDQIRDGLTHALFTLLSTGVPTSHVSPLPERVVRELAIEALDYLSKTFPGFGDLLKGVATIQPLHVDTPQPTYPTGFMQTAAGMRRTDR